MVTGKYGIIIQARMGSTRLPGKVLMKLPYQSSNFILQIIIEKCKRLSFAEKVIVATTINKADDAIIEGCKKIDGCEIFRGSEDNVLERYYEAAIQFNLDHIIRLTADNPFIDPDIIEKTFEFHIDNNSDYTSTSGLPLGTNVEIFNFNSLEMAFKTAIASYDKEHVTPFIINGSEFSKNKIEFPGFDATARLTIDQRNDYALACHLFDHFKNVNKEDFSLEELNEYLNQNPWVKMINENNVQKKDYKNQEEEIIEAISFLKLNGFEHSAQCLEQHNKK